MYPHPFLDCARKWGYTGRITGVGAAAGTGVHDWERHLRDRGMTVGRWMRRNFDTQSAEGAKSGCEARSRLRGSVVAKWGGIRWALETNMVDGTRCGSLDWVL